MLYRLSWTALFWVLLLLALLTGDALGQAAETGPGAYVRHRVDDTAVIVEGEAATLRLTLYRPSVLRVDWYRDAPPDTSLAVVASPQPDLSPTVRETDDALTVRGGALSITVDKAPLRVHVADSTGDAVVREAPQNVSWDDSTRALGLHLAPDTRVYGSGERPVYGLRGHAFDLRNKSQYGYSEAPMTMNINIPFVVTTGGYGLLVDNPYRARLDVGQADSSRLEFRAGGGRLSYYLFAADAIGRQIQQYTALTGRQPLPPKWSLGYMQSKFGYETEAAARGVIDTLRRRNFPVDVLFLDLQWFEHMGDLEWNRTAFPTPFDMMQDLQDRGVRPIAITEPFLTDSSRLIQPAIDSNFVGRTPDGSPYLIGDWWSCDSCSVALFDYTNPDARDWWAAQHPPFMGEAMAGFWSDLGEPERHPADMQLHGGPMPAVHNLYNLLWARTLYRHWRERHPDRRTLNLTRSGYAGIQRFGTSLWSGDVSRSFVGLRGQLPLLLNMSLSGVGYYSSDLGGYAGDSLKPELFARWVQHGVLTPTMRVHGTGTVPTEPWRFGAEVERISRDAIRLRYRLMPYLYSLAWENHRTGMPLVRPLFFADPSDDRLHGYTDAYLVGEALLAAPVVEKGKREKTVRLPAGRWVHWYSHTVYEGGQSVTVDAPLDQLPFFVKAGSIVPTRPVAPHTGAQPADTLGLAVYPDSAQEAAFSLYEDDGTTRAYEREDAYAVTELRQTWERRAKGRALVLRVGAASGTYDGLPQARTLQAAVHRCGAPPRRVAAGGQRLPERSSLETLRREGGWFFDDAEQVLHVQHRAATTDALRIVARSFQLR